jgi:hypothetical protein
MADDASLRRNTPRHIEDAFRPTHDEIARQGLVSALRKHAIVDMKAALEADYKARVEPELAAVGKAPKDWREIERAMQAEPSYRFYSTIRYHAQEMAYQSVLDPIERGLPEMIEVAREAAAANPAAGSLSIDPDFKVPPYVSALDVHLAPGCFHSEHTVDDVAQALSSIWVARCSAAPIRSAGARARWANR